MKNEDTRKLIEAGAFLIPIGEDKQPFKKFKWSKGPWDGKPFKGDMPPHVAVKPGSLDLVVIDIDVKDSQHNPIPNADKIAKERSKLFIDVLGPPLVLVQTKTYGIHMYYKVEEASKIGDKNLKINDKHSDFFHTNEINDGELRAGSGYIGLWNDAVKQIIENILEADKGFITPIKNNDFLERMKPFLEENSSTAGVSHDDTKFVDMNGNLICGEDTIDPPGKTIKNLNTRIFLIQLRNPEPEEEKEKAIQIAKNTKRKKGENAKKLGKTPEDKKKWEKEIKTTVKCAMKAANWKKTEEIDKNFVYSQDDLADEFVKEYAEDFMCTLDKKDKPTWWRWDGKMWVSAKNAVVVNDMIKFAKKKWKKPGTKTQTSLDLLTAGRRSESLGTVQILMGNEKILVDQSNLDKNENLFAMANGDVLDLTSFKVRPQKRDDRITLTSGSKATYTLRINPKKNKKYSWITWTEEKFNDHQRDYAQRFAGYTLYGNNDLQKALALIGGTSCGKSTFLNRLVDFHKDYSFPLASHVLVKEEGARYKDNISDYHKSVLKKIRLVPIVEWDEGDILNADLFSSLAGGDKAISVRGCGKDPTKMAPKFKMILVANHPPLNLTPPVLRKLAIIHMEQSHEGKEDPEWERYFESEEGKAEYQEWILDGAKGVKEKGLADHPKHPNLKINQDPRAIKLHKKLERLVKTKILFNSGNIRVGKLADIVHRVKPDDGLPEIEVAKTLKGVKEILRKELHSKTVNGYELYEGYSLGLNYIEGMAKNNVYGFNPSPV